MKSKILSTTLALFLCGCGMPYQRQPIFYTQPEGRSYSTDLTECRNFAQSMIMNDPTPADGAFAGGLGGAIIGAGLGAIIGAALGVNPGSTAGWGAAGGATGGIARGSLDAESERTRRKESAIIKCMQSRGYTDISF